MSDGRADGAAEPAGGNAAVPEVRPADGLDGAAEVPDEVVVRVTDGHAVVFAADGGSGVSRRGRWLGAPSRAELASLLRGLDPAVRAVIEAKRLTGALVELHPQDREMLADGFKTVTEDGGWMQANFRDHGQVTRLMRVRPATGAAVVSGGALAISAVAAATQAAELAGDVRAIGQRLEHLHGVLQGDLAGAVDSAVGEVEDLVEMLREHELDGVDESRVSVARQALRKANAQCLRRLGGAMADLEKAVGAGSSAGAGEVVTAGAADAVALYLGLAEQLEAATVEFAFAQVAFDCLSGKPDVAMTRAEQVTRQVEAFRRDVDGACSRLAALGGAVRDGLIPWWRVAVKEVAASAGMAVAGAAGSAALAAAPAAAEAVKDGGGGDASGARTAAKVGAAAGLATGLYRGAKKTVQEFKAKAPLDERLGRLADAGTRALEARHGTVPSLDWLQQLTRELGPAPG